MTDEEERVWKVLVRSAETNGREYKDESIPNRMNAVLAADRELKEIPKLEEEINFLNKRWERAAWEAECRKRFCDWVHANEHASGITEIAFNELQKELQDRP